MRRRESYGAVWCPAFPLQAVVRARPELRHLPVGVVDGERLCAVSPEVEAAGAGAEMTPVQAQARCPEMRLVLREPGAERNLQERLVGLAGTWTPEVEDSAPGAVTLGLAGCTVDPEKLVRGLEEALRGEGVGAWAAVAEGADLALLAARVRAEEPGKPPVVPGGVSGARDYVRELPVAAVGEVGEVLALWGIHTLGELAELPVEGLAERLGDEALALWQIASGHGNRRVLRLVRATVTYGEKIYLECGVETLEPLLFQGQRVLEVLGGRLAANGRAAGDIVVTLGFELGGDLTRKLRVPEPSARPDKLFPILESGLETLAVELPQLRSSRDGVVSFAVELLGVTTLGCQLDYLRRGLRDPNAFARTLGRVGALLGPEKLGTPAPGATHRPDVFTLEHDQVNPGTGPGTGGMLRTGLPLRRLRPAGVARVAASVEDGGVEFPRRVGGDAVVALEGPWLASGDWWERGRSWARAEWDVLLEGDGNNGLFRLAQQDGGWCIDGVYAQW